MMSTDKLLAGRVHQHQGTPDSSVRDPVCGMSVDPRTTSYQADHSGDRYFFCSAPCRDLFVVDPTRYLALNQHHEPMMPPHAVGQRLWTCPMHPQIVRSEPGSCPICGMALELMLPTGTEGENPELRRMTRRFWVGVLLSVPLLAMVMAAHVSMSFGALTASRSAVWVQLVLGSAAVLWCGWPFFQRGWASLVARRLNMFSLIALGTGVAYAYSVVAALAPGIFSASFRGPHGEIPLYFEAAAVIVTLVNAHQDASRNQSKRQGVLEHEDRKDRAHEGGR